MSWNNEAKGHDEAGANWEEMWQEAKRKNAVSTRNTIIIVSSLVVVFAIVITALVFAMGNNSDSQGEQPSEPGAGGAADSQGAPQAEQEAAQESDTGAQDDAPPGWFRRWNMDTYIPNPVGESEIARVMALADKRTEKIWRLMRYAEGFEFVFEFSVELESEYYGSAEPNEVYQVTLKTVGDESDIQIQGSDGQVVNFWVKLAEFKRVDAETGEHSNASWGPEWNLYGDYYANDVDMSHYLRPARMFSVVTSTIDEGVVEWQGILCDFETYVYNTYGSSKIIETPEETRRVSMPVMITYYFDAETGEWAGMRFVHSEIIFETDDMFFSAHRHIDFKMLEVMYSS